MWKFQYFSAFQILREINIGHFEALKPAIWSLNYLSSSEFLDFWIFFTFSSFKFPKDPIQSLQNCFTASYWPSEVSQNWFHAKSKGQEKIYLSFRSLEYPQSKFPIRLPRSVHSIWMFNFNVFVKEIWILCFKEWGRLIVLNFELISKML